MIPSHTDPAFEAAFLARYDEGKRWSDRRRGPSLAQRLVALPRADYERILGSLSKAELALLLYEWRGFWARPNQLVPDDVPHRTVLFLKGRGEGKTRSAAERVLEGMRRGVRSVICIGPTWRETLRHVVGGRLGARGNGSGLLDIVTPQEREQIIVREQKGELVFPWLGATVHLASDETPELRGGSYQLAWLDEIGKFKNLQRLWDNLEFTMRVRGEIPPEIIVTTTPRPMRFLKELIADPDTLLCTGTTDDNAVNLDRDYIARLDRKYGGSRIARQERGGELLSDVEDALFHQSIIDATRVAEAPPLKRVVVAIDPAISVVRGNDETGIVAMGLGHDDHLYVLDDASGRWSPDEWGREALRLYDRHKADAYVCERNRGGDLVQYALRATLREKRGSAAVAKVVEVHASRGKEVRAEPVSVISSQGRLHFVGVHPAIEQELTEFSPRLGGISPNRLDAVVWAAFELARLGEEEKADYRAGFKGLSQASVWLGNQMRSSPLPGHGPAMPRWPGGGKL